MSAPLLVRRCSPANSTRSFSSLPSSTSSSSSSSSSVSTPLSPSHLKRSRAPQQLVAVRPFAKIAATPKHEGAQGTKEWRVFLFSGDKKISPWHDLPLYPPGGGPRDVFVNYVNEIPRGTRPKYEIATKEPGNPIKQDVKKGALRLFTYGDIPFNYGCLPQTWEDPHHAHKDTGLKGDNDPLDVVELSEEPLPVGEVVTVRVLGLLGLLDEGETDWKILAIRQGSPLYDQLLDSDDLETFFPKTVNTIRDWFRRYKTTDGKPENSFAFDEKIRGQAYAMRVVNECHVSWQSLIKGTTPAGELSIPPVKKN